MKKAFIYFFPILLLGIISLQTHAQETNKSTTTITGKVTDEDGVPLPGITVRVKQGPAHAVTDADGVYHIDVSPQGTVLIFSSVGFQEKEVRVNNRSLLNVSMTKNTQALSDVVVIGYGTQKKGNITGAVASFDASKLDERPLTRVDQALVGQMAGVTVKQTSGGLGAGFSIQIRGVGSISAGNEPLYVIDGFPLSTATPNSVGGYSDGNPLDNLNPNDIESIEVLKDAAAAAIYGSRAANGVVLITTKRGKSGSPKISVNTDVGFMERSRKLDMLSSSEWIDRATEMINAAWVASGTGRTADQTNEERRTILGLASGQVNTGLMTDDRWTEPGHPGLRFIDWQDEAFRKGLVQDHQVSASGGNDFVHYYISGDYVRQEGMVKYTDYTQYSARANVEVNANKKLRFGLNIAPTYSINNDPGVEGKDAIIHVIASMSPVQEDTMGVYPNIGDNGQYRWSNSRNSPIGTLRYKIGQTKIYRTLTSFYTEYEPIRDLHLKTTLNLDNADSKTGTYVPYIISGSVAARQAQQTALTSGTYSSYRKQTFVNENTVSYDKTIHNEHHISLLAGISYNSSKLSTERIASTGGFSSNAITTLNAANAVTGNTTETLNVLLSYFGRLQYAFGDKYLLSASLRRDGSSRFGSNTKWGWFPSASVGWRVSQEKFMNSVHWLNDLKLRASWGASGNYNIGDYSTIATLGVYNYTFGGQTAIGQAPSGVANKDLTWEKSETFDVGFDAGVLNNRITASFDYYTRLSTRLLLNVPIPEATGFSTTLSNAGEVRNRGWEVEITSRNVTGPFEWTTSANLSHNQNKVVSLAGGQTQILIPSSFDISHSILQIGQPIYSIYVVKQIGILSQDDINKGAALFGTETVGDPKYLDADNNGVIDANDRVIVGHPTPDYTWGITNTFRYKGFDLSFLVQGQWGGSIYSLLGRALGRTGQGYVDNALGFYRDRWRSADNPGAGRVGKAYSTFGRIVNTDWLYPSDYVRVRDITLGYNLGGALKKKWLQAARLYVTAENFFGHDKYLGGFNPEATNTNLSGSTDYPEAGDYGGLPLPRSLVLGLNVTF